MHPLDHDALGQADLVARGEVSPLELVNAAIRRIEDQDSSVNAVTMRLFDQARASAAELGEGGVFRGVPFLVKDFLCHMQGTATTASSRILCDTILDHDSELMRRYRRAGLIPLGKTNVPEMVSMGTTEPALFGPTRNPWDLDRSAGGSSGGSAAAVAAGYVAVAHANDGAGSVRIPASCCGLFGLKPSRGRITLGPDVGESIGGITSEHVVTRSVRDSAAMLDATQGTMPGDPYAAPATEGSFLDAMQDRAGRLRIALSPAPAYAVAVDPDCAAALREAALLCQALGHEVVEASPALNGETLRAAMESFWPMTVTRALTALARQRGVPVAVLEADLEPFNQHLLELGLRRTAADYLRDLTHFQAVTRTLGVFLDRFDVWLTPTMPTLPTRLGHYDAGLHGADAVLSRVMDSFAFTVPANLAGLPAASVPLYWTAGGLPVGVQIMARLGGEPILFKLAAQLEDARPWRDRRPALP